MITFAFLIRFSKELTRFKGFLSLGLVHIRFAIERPKSAEQIIEAKQARQLMQAKRYVLDATKRKSLQPGNEKVISLWQDVNPPAAHASHQVEIMKAKPKQGPIPPAPPKVHNPTKQRVSQAPMDTAPLKPAFFEHKFFGSQFIVGDRVIASGLAKKLHFLEITDTQLLIDNIPQPVNQGELENIKALVHSART